MKRWVNYEHGVLEAQRHKFERRGFRVEGTVDGVQHRIRGLLSHTLRQLDVAVYRRDSSTPFLIADAKHRAARLDIGDVDAFIGLMADVGAEVGLLVAPLGASPGAHKRASADQAWVEVMSYEEALVAELLPIARQMYPWDWEFHPQMARAVRAILEGEPWEDTADHLWGVPFEEWERFFEYGLSHHAKEADAVLSAVALHHHDDGWVYNAARLLLEHDRLAPELRTTLAGRNDPELRELLEVYEGE